MGELEDSGLRPGTVRKVYDVMRQLMKAAVLDRRIPFNPCDSVELPQEDRREQRFLNAGEIDALVEAMTEVEPRFRAFILLGVFGGLRFGELAGLRRISPPRRDSSKVVSESATALRMPWTSPIAPIV